MAQRSLSSLLGSAVWVCRQCQHRGQSSLFNKQFSRSAKQRAEEQIKAAPEIDFNAHDASPARILPASASYFTSSPVFNDNILVLQQIVERHSAIPTAPADQVPRISFMKLSQYRSTTGEKVTASKYARVLNLLSRLNKIHPDYRPKEVQGVLKRFERPGAAEAPQPKVGQIDEYGRSIGVGRRKASSARVWLVEGTGEILINGKGIVQAFPRVHHRESALWPLKISGRMDKYNVFARTEGGGITGQAESITLALARALLIQEPALKPVLRRAGCVTRDPRKVERKKPGHVKARKMPTWVKR